MVRHYMDSESQPLVSRLQAAFARLQQTHPAVGSLFRHRCLWDDAPAQQAVDDLHTRLCDTLERIRADANKQLGGSRAPGSWLVRTLLTVGAVLWFPLLQPLLEAYLSPGRAANLALLAVKLTSVTHLFTNLGFLAGYFLVLWLAIRWSTQRRVDRWLTRHQRLERPGEDLSLTGQVVAWMNDLLAPLRESHRRLASVVKRAARARAKIRGANGIGSDMSPSHSPAA
jgi:hypothetical protein